MTHDVTIKLPFLWGDDEFRQADWGPINYLVGPNGTGKSEFLKQLQTKLPHPGTRYLSTERLTGLESQRYPYTSSSNIGQGLNITQLPQLRNEGEVYGLAATVFAKLRERLDLKIKVEAVLSQLFARRVEMTEKGGFIDPTVQTGKASYRFISNECHGLKELVILVATILDPDYSYIVMDEPELHLHPQLQGFLLQLIRECAGDPKSDQSKKCFFIATHSPCMVELQTVGDMTYLLVFRAGRLPARITSLDSDEDESRIRRLLPRLNTHHKQFLFASSPVFVEGYTDQQLFALIIEKLACAAGANGACFVDVGGKDELELFFRLTRQLGIPAAFIADIDAMLVGKLRQTVCRDARCASYLSTTGTGADPSKVIGELETSLDACASSLGSATESTAPTDARVKHLLDSLISTQDPDAKRRMLLVAMATIPDDVMEPYIKGEANRWTFSKGRLQVLVEAFAKSGVYFLRRGQLENYLPSFNGDPSRPSDKTKSEAFDSEREFLMKPETSASDVAGRYGELADMLRAITSARPIDYAAPLADAIRDFIHAVQMAVNRKETQDISSLKLHYRVAWASYSRILDIKEFKLTPAGFTCTVAVLPAGQTPGQEFTFDQSTSAAAFTL